ncbi:MAG TPA: polysaccharide deacetylase family protein [Bacteroidales bacterium]|nr:polysaccharide deacetylase family protein [Bacteroidales bacterium]
MDVPVIKIYARFPSPRLQYITGFIFGDLLGVTAEIITDKRKIGHHPLINYTSERLKNAFNIMPAGLLYEPGIRKYNPEVQWWNSLPVIFPSPGGSDLPFDIFSASFYMITRYEEYTCETFDRHGRFPASSSLAYRNGFLHRPVVNLWVWELARHLVKAFPRLAFKRSRFSALATFDIDEPFKYRGKDTIRKIGALIMRPGKNGYATAEKYRIISGKQTDPWDIFDFLISKAKEEETDIIFFMPAGDRSAYDNWPSWQNIEFRKLLKNIAAKAKTGLHPSYKAGINGSLLISEKNRLNQITGLKAEAARFHYIRFRLPDSLNNLETAGFRKDYSMGFHDEPGFRAGTSSPFLFFNPVTDRLSDLQIVPFQFMDATMIHYKKMSPSRSIEIIKSLIDETRKAGGIFQSVWHNNIIASDENSENWKSAFEFTLKYQKNDDKLS